MVVRSPEKTCSEFWRSVVGNKYTMLFLSWTYLWTDSVRLSGVYNVLRCRTSSNQ
jgi:hypothetical protein